MTRYELMNALVAHGLTKQGASIAIAALPLIARERISNGQSFGVPDLVHLNLLEDKKNNLTELLAPSQRKIRLQVRVSERFKSSLVQHEQTLAT